MRVGRHGKEKPRAGLASMRDTGHQGMEKLVSSYTLYFLCLMSLAAGLTVQMPRARHRTVGDTECQHSH